MKTITHFITIILVTFLLEGCMGMGMGMGMGADAGTGIHPDGYYSNQFRATPLSDDVVLISYGKPSNKTEQTQYYSRALRRAAEITVERRYGYFKVLGRRDFIETGKIIYMFSAENTFHYQASEIKIKLLKNKSPQTFDASNALQIPSLSVILVTGRTSHDFHSLVSMNGASFYLDIIFF